MHVTQQEMIEMKKVLLAISTLFFIIPAFGQEWQWQKGKVSFVSASNVYVKFDETADIKSGDTLFIANEGTWSPALIVKKKSSLSVVTILLPNFKTPIVGDEIRAKGLKAAEVITPTTEPLAAVPVVVTIDTADVTIKNDKKDRKPLVNGRFSVSTNASLADGDNNYQRIRMAYTLNASNLGGGNFSTQQYITYRHRYGIDQQLGFYNDFKIYTLALSYEKGGHIATLGRRINSRITNMGAIDGIQYEKKSGDWIGGMFVGSRPDPLDYTFNINLMQGGVFVSHEHQTKEGLIQTSLAFVEQRNHAETDRRFTYFQHSSTIGKNINLFGSVELDIYQKIKEQVSHSIKLTGAYFSLRYRPFRALNLTASYDNRRNVIFYETNRTYIDQLLNQETRQGYRLMVSYNIWRNININGSAFYRYQENAATPTKNYVANVTFNNMLKGVNLGFNANLLESYYFNGSIIGGRIDKNLLNGQANLEVNYRKVNYLFFSGEQTLKQDIVGFSVNINVSRLTSFVLSYEGTFDPIKNYHRYFVTAIQRFKN